MGPFMIEQSHVFPPEDADGRSDPQFVTQRLEVNRQQS